MDALAAVSEHLGELQAESRKRALSTHGAVVSVAPKERACPRCGGPTVVQKSLWGHVIMLPPEAGGGIRLVDRTNNSEEGLFHTMKHGLRRQSGRKILTQDFENLPAAAALAYNLERPDYVQILCGSLEQLPDAIAALDQQGHIRRLAATTTEHVTKESAEIEMLSSSLPRVDRPVIRAMGLGQRIAAAAKSRAPHYAVP